MPSEYRDPSPSKGERGFSRPAALVACGVASEAACVGTLWLGDLRYAVPELAALFMLMGAAMVMAVRVMSASRPGSVLRRRQLGVIIAFAVLFRATLLASPPTLSDDMYRYLWEGKLLLHGENPFLLPPSAPEYAELRDEYHALINHPDMTAVYPPVAQALFAAGGLLQHGPLGFKVLAVAADLGLIWMLILLLGRHGRDPCWVLMYAWHPLPVLEFAASGHLDVFAVFFMVAAFVLAAGDRHWTAALSLLAGALTKVFPVAMVPTLARTTGWRVMIGAAVPLGLVALVPFAGAGSGLFRSALQYASHWRFNEGGFTIVEAVLGGELVARVAVVLAFGAASVVLPLRWPDPMRVGLALTGFFVLFSPTVHPWYLAWVIPFLCFYPKGSWIYLSLAVVLAYHVLIPYSLGGVWALPGWVRAAEYLPFAVLFIAEMLPSFRARRGSDAEMVDPGDGHRLTRRPR